MDISDGCFYLLAQEEFDYLYSTVNSKKKAPSQPNREFTKTELSKSTVAGINTKKNPYPQMLQLAPPMLHDKCEIRYIIFVL